MDIMTSDGDTSVDPKDEETTKLLEKGMDELSTQEASAGACGGVDADSATEDSKASDVGKTRKDEENENKK